MAERKQQNQIAAERLVTPDGWERMPAEKQYEHLTTRQELLIRKYNASRGDERAAEACLARLHEIGAQMAAVRRRLGREWFDEEGICIWPRLEFRQSVKQADLDRIDLDREFTAREVRLDGR